MKTSTQKRTAIALLCAGSALLLQACGGGGGDGTAAVPEGNPPSEVVVENGETTTQPTAAITLTSEVGIALQDGLFSVSYGIGTINSIPDHSIWQTRLGATDQGRRELVRSVYAGNSEGGTDMFSDVIRDFEWDVSNASRVFSPRASDNSGFSPARGQLDDRASELVVGRSVGEAGESRFEPRTTWGLRVSRTDLSGAPVKDFLLKNESRSKPYSDLAIASNFPTGSLGIRFTYTAKTDTFIYPTDHVFVSSEKDFVNYGQCVREPDPATGTRLAWFHEANGQINIYEIAADAKCSRADAKSGLLIGKGTWTRKMGQAFDYWQIDFPASVPYSRADATFSQAEYDAGIRPVYLANGRNGRWASAFLVPAGTSFEARNLALNRVAANAVKGATGL